MKKVLVFLVLCGIVLSGCDKGEQAKKLSSNYHTYIGIVFEKLWLWDSAKTEYGKALEINPKNALAHRGMAMTYIGQNNYSDAVKHIIKAIKCDPSWVKGYLLKARVYEKLNNKQRAIESYRKYLDESPNMDPSTRQILEEKIRILSI